MAKLPHLQHLDSANAFHEANSGLVGKSAGAFHMAPKGGMAMHPKAIPAAPASVQSQAQKASVDKAAAVSAEKRRGTQAGQPGLQTPKPGKPGKLLGS